MRRLFLSITKGEELRFLGHLDYLRTLERAVLRAGIPVAFSEGFNPHMKLSRGYGRSSLSGYENRRRYAHRND